MSKRAVIGISLLSSILGGLIVGALFLFYTHVFIPDQTQNVYKTGAGQKMLSEFQCRYGETKHIFLHGSDDNFTLDEDEPGRQSPRLASYPGHPVNTPYQRSYDETGPDKALTNYFDLPPNVTRGLFIIRLQVDSNFENDTMSLGDLTSFDHNVDQRMRHAINVRLHNLKSMPGWKKTPNNIFSARFEDVKFQLSDRDVFTRSQSRVYRTLLSYVQSAIDGATVEYVVFDDTAVDYAGIVVCTGPEEPLGLTFSEYIPIKSADIGMQLIDCGFGFKTYTCNPILGDTPCTKSLPLACIKDTGAPVPKLSPDIDPFLSKYVKDYWASGDVEFTNTVRGDSFKNIAEANQYCSETFGEGFRVASFHDGGIKGIASLQSHMTPKGRVWIDIRDQPDGTCWGRE